MHKDGGGGHLAYDLRRSAEHISAAFNIRLEDAQLTEQLAPGAELFTIFEAGLRALPTAREKLDAVFRSSTTEQRGHASTVIRRLTTHREKLERAVHGYESTRAWVRQQSVERQQAVTAGVERLKDVLEKRCKELIAHCVEVEENHLAAIDARERHADAAIALALELESTGRTLLQQTDPEVFALGYADMQPGIRRVFATCDPTASPVLRDFGCNLGANA